MLSRKIKVKKGTRKRSRSLDLGAARQSGTTRVSLAARRRKQRMVVMVAAVLAVPGLGVLGIWGMHHDVFKVAEVSVTGSRDIPKETLEAHVRSHIATEGFSLLPKDTTFFYPKNQILVSAVSTFPRIRTTDMRANSIIRPTLTLSIVEREPHALWCHTEGTDCYFIDIDGVIFAKADSVVPLNTYTYTGGVARNEPIGKQLLPSHFTKVNQLVGVLEDEGFVVHMISVLNEHDFDVITDSDMHIRASFLAEYRDTLSNVQTALASDALHGRESELEYIDVRFGNKVYFKFQDITTTEE